MNDDNQEDNIEGSYDKGAIGDFRGFIERLGLPLEPQQFSIASKIYFGIDPGFPKAEAVLVRIDWDEDGNETYTYIFPGSEETKLANSPSPSKVHLDELIDWDFFYSTNPSFPRRPGCHSSSFCRRRRIAALLRACQTGSAYAPRVSGGLAYVCRLALGRCVRAFKSS